MTCASLAFSGCASSRMSDHESDNLFREGRYEEAAERLKKGMEENDGPEGKDGLLYLLDIGLSLHAAGKYAESNKYFLEADKMAEIKDYTSLAAESAGLLTSDNVKQYKGEDFENTLINVYLAMNYAALGAREDALVEARRVNRKLNLMKTEGKRNYKQNAFARYLSAVLYESEKDWNNALLDYKFTADLAPGMPGIGVDQWRMAYALRMTDRLRELEKKYRITHEEKAEARSLVNGNGAGRPGEIVVIYENGISPRKLPNPSWNSIPQFYPRNNPVVRGRAMVEGMKKGLDVQETETFILHDVQATAIQNLEEKWGGILAKKVAGIVAKEVAGAAVASATKNEGIGQIVKLALYLSDQADLRSWNLLPRDLQVARFVVKPGNYQVKLEPIGMGALPEKVVAVAPGQKVFVNFRFMPVQ